ncbi:MAG: hypothetical protein WDA03_07545 [Trueperaceae bacterium]
MFKGSMLSTLFLTLTLAQLACTALAQHPATGVYAYDSPVGRFEYHVHVAPDGTLTGVAMRASRGFGTYFEGRYEDGRAVGYYYDTTTILTIAIVLEFDQDVMTAYVYPGDPNTLPDPPPEPRYLLRLPGPGPERPLQPDVHVLLRLGRNEAVIATSAAGTELRLGDARNFLEAALLAMREAGLEGPLFPGTIYLNWVGYAVTAFEAAELETQELMANSQLWWPALEAEWPGAPREARQRVAQDVLLLVFGPGVITGWLEEVDAGYEVPPGPTCSALMTCVLRVFDRSTLAAATSRLPCFSVSSCPETGVRD